MCVVSMISDHYTEKWQRYTEFPVQPSPWRPITQDEVDEFRRLLERARDYDRKMNEPNCVLDEKRRALKRLAERLGIDISFIDPILADVVDTSSTTNTDNNSK